VVFDQAGKYLRDFGREGAGPGEFASIRPCWMKDGRVVVWDALQYRASIFTTDGLFLDSYTRGHFIGRHSVEETGGYRFVVYRIRPAVDGLEYP
jgi:hypothetical protein